MVQRLKTIIMRKFILLCVITVMSLASCDKSENGNYVVDWSPVSLFVKVADAQGADLLDPKNPENMIDGTTITYKGVTYKASRTLYETGLLDNEPQTKALLARIYGLYLVSDSTQIEPAPVGFSLRFGDIDGAADMDEDLIVTLPDGTTGTIHYHCSKHNEKKLSCNRSWKFNGEKTDRNVFTFVVSK